MQGFREILRKGKGRQKFSRCSLFPAITAEVLFELGPCREAMQTAVSTQRIVCYKLLPVINSTLCLKAHVISRSRIQYRGLLY